MWKISLEVYKQALKELLKDHRYHIASPAKKTEMLRKKITEILKKNSKRGDG